MCLDTGGPVYLYEFVYRADIHRNSRPSFVKADHADDVTFMFGGCFWNGHIKVTGRSCSINILYVFLLFLLNT